MGLTLDKCRRWKSGDEEDFEESYQTKLQTRKVGCIFHFTAPRILDRSMLGRDNTKFKVAGALAQIQVIATSDSPIDTILNGFYTAEVMNFISWNSILDIP